MATPGIPSQLKALKRQLQSLGAELDEESDRREQDVARLEAQIAEVPRTVRWLEKRL